MITYNYKCAEAEATATLYDAGHTVNMNNSFVKLFLFFSLSLSPERLAVMATRSKAGSLMLWRGWCDRCRCCWGYLRPGCCFLVSHLELQSFFTSSISKSFYSPMVEF